MRISGKTVLIVLVLAGLAYWGFFLGGFSIFNGTGDTVTLRVQTEDSIGEAVFSPAGAAVKVWDKASGTYLGSMTEDSSNDGKWDGTFPVAVGSVVVVQVSDSGSTYYTKQVERVVHPAAAGVDRVSILDPIYMNPRSATSADDIAGTIMTAGSEVDNSTNIASGETEMQFIFTVSSGKTWGGQPYFDYEQSKNYYGAFLVFDLTTTTARATITGSFAEHFSLGSHEYWIFKLPQIVNDADIATDGSYQFTITFNNLVAAADSLSIDFYTNRLTENVLSASFGTSDQADSWDQIHLA